MSDNATPVVKTEMKTGGAVMAFVPQNYEEAWRIATTVCKAGMAPKGLESPEKVMVAIMHGQEVGFTPMASLQSIAVINGRPTIWGDGALGLVQGSGKMEWIKEWSEGDGDAMVAHCHVKRINDPEIKKASFSVADAKAAGLLGKQGPWTQYRPRMLKMRARSWALRDGFSDVLKGLGVAEEVQDIPAAPEKTEHTVVGSEPLTEGATPAPVSMPRVVSAPNAAPISHEPDAYYEDEILRTVVAPATEKRPEYYGIYTKAHGKTPLGTFDKALYEKAKAATGCGPIQIKYTVEGNGLKLVGIGADAEQEAEAA